jgi:Mg-chelatase subunit ChlD
MAVSKKQKGMEVFILLDRTGSMASLWEEAVTSVNAYVRELKMDGADDRITLAVFDAYESGMQFDVLRHAVAIGEWKDFEADEVLPRGMTPLLDALMRIITRAEEVNNEKTAIVVMTDGHENASTEVSLQDARVALDRVQKKNWQVNFLGANFDGFDQAAGLGVAHGVTMNFYAGQANDAMSSTARTHSEYRRGKQAIAYSDEDRKNAREDDVK